MNLLKLSVFNDRTLCILVIYYRETKSCIFKSLLIYQRWTAWNSLLLLRKLSIFPQKNALIKIAVDLSSAKLTNNFQLFSFCSALFWIKSQWTDFVSFNKKLRKIAKFVSCKFSCKLIMTWINMIFEDAAVA